MSSMLFLLNFTILFTGNNLNNKQVQTQDIIKNNINNIKIKEENEEYFTSKKFINKMKNINNIITKWKKTKKIPKSISYNNKKYEVLYNNKEIIIKNIPLDFSIYFSNQYIIENNNMYIPVNK